MVFVHAFASSIRSLGLTLPSRIAFHLVAWNNPDMHKKACLHTAHRYEISSNERSQQATVGCT
jgi:hypothetical protein